MIKRMGGMSRRGRRKIMKEKGKKWKMRKGRRRKTRKRTGKKVKK